MPFSQCLVSRYCGTTPANITHTQTLNPHHAIEGMLTAGDVCWPEQTRRLINYLRPRFACNIEILEFHLNLRFFLGEYFLKLLWLPSSWHPLKGWKCFYRSTQSTVREIFLKTQNCRYILASFRGRLTASNTSFWRRVQKEFSGILCHIFTDSWGHSECQSQGISYHPCKGHSRFLLLLPDIWAVEGEVQEERWKPWILGHCCDWRTSRGGWLGGWDSPGCSQEQTSRVLAVKSSVNNPTPQFQAEAALCHIEGGVERGRHESSIQRSGSSSAEGISCQFCPVHWIWVDNKGHCVHFLKKGSLGQSEWIRQYGII